jgi:hypothetical protein
LIIEVASPPLGRTVHPERSRGETNFIGKIADNHIKFLSKVK